MKNAAVYKIYRFCVSVYKYMLRIRSERYLLKIRKQKKAAGIIRVAFLVQSPMVWDKQEDVYEKMKADSRFEVTLLVVPDRSIYNMKKADAYRDSFFLKKYPEAVKVIGKRGRVTDIRQYGFHYIFYPRPYDAFLPGKLRSVSVAKYARCVYIPYAFSGGTDEINKHLVYQNPFYDAMHIVFADSRENREFLKKRYSQRRRKLHHIVYLGYPVFGKYIGYEKHKEQRITVTWTPRWSNDALIGGSSFLDYKDRFIDFVRKNPSMKYIFRPHPLMFDNLIQNGELSQEEKEEFLCRLKELKIETDLTSSIEIVLRKTDILLTDFSSIVIMFFLMGGSIVYCEKGMQLNDTYKEIMDYVQVAHNWEEAEAQICQLACRNDEKQSDRKKFIMDKYRKDIHAAEHMTAYIIKDFLE